MTQLRTCNECYHGTTAPEYGGEVVTFVSVPTERSVLSESSRTTLTTSSISPFLVERRSDVPLKCLQEAKKRDGT